MRLTPRSLRGRMALAFLAPAALFLAALTGLAFVAARTTLEDEVGARLAGIASATAALLPTGLVARYQPGQERTHANLVARLQRAVESTGVRRAFIATLDGRSLADTAADAPPPGEPDRDLAQDRFELTRVARGETVASVLYESHDGVRYKRGFAPIRHEGAIVGVLGVEGSAASYAGLDRLRHYMLGLGAVALTALAGIVLVFSRALDAPIRSLADAARRIGAGALDEPVRVRGAGVEEVTVLARTMEEMRDALQRRDRELQLMLGGIAHEVRNPLGGMELFAGLLREDLADQPEPLALLARVETELGNLKRVVEEFLTYARRAPVEKAEVPLTAVVAEAAALAGVEARVEPPEARVRADPDQLRRLLLNLLRNARQAGATGVRVRRGGEALHIEDDGPGIGAEHAGRIFDAFYTTREQGTGLGLALCRRIAEDHGGRLELENPGEPGARFRLDLPA